MRRLLEISKEELLADMESAVRKKCKMVLSNTASNETENVNESSMKSWVKSSPFFLNENETEGKTENN